MTTRSGACRSGLSRRSLGEVEVFRLRQKFGETSRALALPWFFGFSKLNANTETHSGETQCSPNENESTREHREIPEPRENPILSRSSRFKKNFLGEDFGEIGLLIVWRMCGTMG